MKITDEEIQKDLETCEKRIGPFDIQMDAEETSKYITSACNRWPLYIKELIKLRQELEDAYKS